MLFESRPTAEDQRLPWNLNVLMLNEEYSRRLEKDNTSEDNLVKAAELRETISKASVELLNGVSLCSQFVVAIGRKI